MADDIRIISGSEWLSRPIPPRPRRHDSPVEYDATPVFVRGDALHQILWRGRQWAVTTYGIERLDGTYPIAADRITEDLGTKGYGGWPCHMGEKVWCDNDDFVTAWLVAQALHGKDAKFVRDAVANAHPQRPKETP